MKRIQITFDQADNLETELTSIVAENGYEAKHLKAWLAKDLGLPQEVVKGILSRLDAVISSIALVEGGSAFGDRTAYEGVVDDFKSLDAYLDKRFQVVGKRGGKKPYSFNVG